MPLHAEEWLTISIKDLGNFQDRVRSIMARWGKERNKHPLPSRVFDELIEQVFIPSFGLIYSLGEQLKAQEKVIWRMTEDQFKYIDFIEAHSRAIIKGYVGTGKTILTQEKARRSALAGRKVLLLCYNQPLMEYLSSSIQGFEADISVETFHGICRRYIVESGQEFEPPDVSDKVFWEEDVPAMMLIALDIVTERFETIIVDEAQDFSANWWDVVESLLYSPKENELYLFFDPHQNIYHKENLFPVQSIPFTLTENCRNTCHITRTVAELADIEIKNPHNHPEGHPVEFHHYQTEEEELSIIERIVRRLVFDDNIHPREIVIISPYNKARSSLRNYSEILEIPLVDAPLPTTRRKLRFSSIGRFKGLESGVVIIVDVDELVLKDILRLYVGVSRAKYLLFVLSKHPVL